jgi:hypothetical protein
MVKAAFNTYKTPSTSKLDLNFRKKLLKCNIWSTFIHGSETRTFRKVENEDLGSFEMWLGEGWRRSVGPIL